MFFMKMKVLAVQTIAHQVSLSMGFSRQTYWSGLPGPSPGDLPDLGIKPVSLTSPALAGRFSTTSATWANQTPTSRGYCHKYLCIFSLSF